MNITEYVLLSDAPATSTVAAAGGIWRKALLMDTCVGEMRSAANTGLTGPPKWVHHVIALLDAAACQLDHEQAVHGTILRAASLLRKQIDLEVAGGAPERRGGLLAWQARKVRAYIDTHITGPMLVAELGALVQLSEAHFSRAFRRTFGYSPHAFVIRRRVDFAAQYMLQTEAPLSDIALRCGFTDQPHLCKHFRQTTGHTPAAWRRAHSGEDVGDRHHAAPRFLQEHVQTDLTSPWVEHQLS
jgi:AraC family transcriptional regulator